MPVDLMNELLSRLTNFTVVDYLNWIRQVLGEAVYQQLLQLSPDILNFEKVFTLQEQYLYGSKRLGVRRPKLLLATAPHTGSGYQTPIEAPAPGGGYNHDCNCYVRELPNAGGSPPPSSPSFATRFYIHELGRKEYELSNHLGNVLATVLDRKTGVKASPTATTYAWFKADVASAQDYYPFGSLLPGRTYTAAVGEGYRFGMNEQERDDEIYGAGNSHSALYWQYDARLGRRWNKDPKPNSSISMYATFANNPIWFSDHLGDTVRNSGFSQRKILKVLNQGIEISRKNSPFRYDKNGDLQINQKNYDMLTDDKKAIVDDVKGAIESDIVFTIKKARQTDIIPGSTLTVGYFYGAATAANLGKNRSPDLTGKSGVTIYWTGQTQRSDDGSTIFQKSPTLYHELGGHGYHRYQLKLHPVEASTIAVDVENGVRDCMGLNYRRNDEDHPSRKIEPIPMKKIEQINK